MDAKGIAPSYFQRLLPEAQRKISRKDSELFQQQTRSRLSLDFRLAIVQRDYTAALTTLASSY